MKKNNQTYIKILLVIAVSVTLIIVARWINLNGFVQGVASIPAACALLAALFQILRDQFNYEKEEELQKKQDFFNLGITSHMAQVAFDKHVEFCEEYMKELHETVSTLFERGPTDKVMKHVSNFYELKHKYSLWITDNISLKLDVFEKQLKDLGVKAHFLNSMNDPKEHERTINEMYDIFADILGLARQNGTKIDADSAVRKIKLKIREILGIEELTKLRERIIRQAIKSI